MRQTITVLGLVLLTLVGGSSCSTNRLKTCTLRHPENPEVLVGRDPEVDVFDFFVVPNDTVCDYLGSPIITWTNTNTGLEVEIPMYKVSCPSKGTGYVSRLWAECSSGRWD